MNREESWLLEEKYGGEKTEGFFADCDRLSHGEPVAYLIGHVPFLSTTIHLDSRPLIPRPETEFWVSDAIRDMAGKDSTEVRVLDLCAGSGCIGVAVLKTLPTTRVDFVEIDSLHHPTIQKNITENSIDLSRTSILGGDTFEHVTSQYDFILTNPPYIDRALGRTDEAVLAHEPHRALFGGIGGMEIIASILTHASRHLRASGVLYLEHEPEQSEAIQRLAKEHGLVTETKPDQYNISRYTRFTRADSEMMAS